MIYLFVFFLTVLLTIMIKQMAIIDKPNARSAHTTPIPTGGGLGFVLAFYSGVFYLFYSDAISSHIFYALLAGLILVLVGFIDDYKELSPQLRLFAQLLSIMIALYALGSFDLYPWWLLLFFIFAGLWLINLYNFMDGIDGYAGSEGIVVALGGYLFYHDSLFIMIAVVLCGFLLFNWQRASIFMGDVGSTFLGFFFAIMIVYHYHDSKDLVIWFILLGLFIVDASRTLLRRIYAKDKLVVAHKKHYFQRLVQSGFSHQKVVLLGMGWNLFWIIMIALSLHFDIVYLAILCYAISIEFVTRWIDKRKGFDV